MKNALILIAALLFVGCKKKVKPTYDKDAVACGTKNPIENLNWLSAQFNASYTEDVILYKLDDKEIVDIGSGVYSSRDSRRQYSCDGKMIEYQDPKTYDNYIKNRILIKQIYPYSPN